MPAPLLRVENLRVVPLGAGAPACEDVSFELGRGERAALVGASGAGKTSLLRAINGSLPAQAGRIIVNGQTLNARAAGELRRFRRNVAVVPQKHDLVDGLRVYHNVMAGALGRWSNARALRFLFWPLRSEIDEARHALERVDLSEKLEASAGTLSGGQQQRVAIARALIQKPRVILADEPVASLDPRMAHQVLQLLCKVAEDEGVALLCTLHQPELADRYFPRVLEMHRGRLTADRRATRDDGGEESRRPSGLRAVQA